MSSRVARWALLLLCSGCAMAIESSRVSRRFSTVFNCPNPTVRGVGGGYVAEGCGVVAHFSCFDDGDDDDYEAPPGASVGGAILGAVLHGMIAGSLDPDTCILEHAERPASVAPPTPAERVSRAREPTQGLTVRARVVLKGGQLKGLGRPEAHPEHVLLTVHTTKRLPSGACQAELFRDGVRLPVEQVRRQGAYDVRLLMRSEQLRNVHHAVRLSGAACGFEFELDEAGRETLGIFYARFAEERARAQAAASVVASSGGESVGDTRPAGRSGPSVPRGASEAGTGHE